MQLTQSDFDVLDRSYITPALANAAGLYRVDSLEGRDLIGRKGAGDYAGVVYPVVDLYTRQVVANFLRLDHPPVDAATGKVGQKYLCAPGQRNKIYSPLEDPLWLADPSIPVLIVEGPKKCLAVHRAAEEASALRNGSTGKPAWVTIAFSGVWNWRGVIGYTTDAQGHRVPVKGPIPDLDKIAWARKVVIGFDSNAAFQSQVTQARRALAQHLASRGAQVAQIDLPQIAGVNGPDDFLAAEGLEAYLDLWDHATAWDWHRELVRSDKDKVLPLVTNALTALRLAPEWRDGLRFSDFSLEIEITRPTPWNAPPGAWQDRDDTLLAAWLECQGICLSEARVSRVVEAIAREHSYHPVRDYLNGLKWDRTGRIDDWLVLYLGADPNDPSDPTKINEYVRAVGARWLISAVARAFQPGSKVDHTLILEGLQGGGKSQVFEILGGPFFKDDIPELGTKDSQQWIASGVWICELAELDAMSKADASRIKKFLTETGDRFRPPYARHLMYAPRQCVFGGTINSDKYLKDDTGNRRFWPVECGKGLLNLDALRRDRDQLWAEAVVRYQKGEKWWLEAPELVQAAEMEQEERLQIDPWEPVIRTWALGQTDVTTADVLTLAIKKEMGQWTRADETRVGTILRRLGWKTVRPTGNQKRVYRQGP